MIASIAPFAPPGSDVIAGFGPTTRLRVAFIRFHPSQIAFFWPGAVNGAGSQRDNSQARDALKVAEVPRAHRVAEFQRASSDQKIPERKSNAFGGLLPAEPGNDLRRNFRNRMDRDRGFNLVKVCTPPSRISGVLAR